jgi:hypothetical protein
LSPARRTTGPVPWPPTSGGFSAGASSRKKPGARGKEAEREERERLAKLEQERVEHLLNEAENWRRAADLRVFVESVRKASPASPSPATDTLERWAAWVLALADRIDPIRAGRIPGEHLEQAG